VHAGRSLLAALVVGLALVPNNPGQGWYAVPEVVCGWFHGDEDQWQCDADPVAWTPHVVTRRPTKRLDQ